MSRPPGRHVAMLVTLFELFNSLEHFIPSGIEATPDETEPIESRNAIFRHPSLLTALALALDPNAKAWTFRPPSWNGGVAVLNSEFVQVRIHLRPDVLGCFPRQTQAVQLLNRSDDSLPFLLCR